MPVGIRRSPRRRREGWRWPAWSATTRVTDRTRTGRAPLRTSCPRRRRSQLVPHLAPETRCVPAPPMSPVIGRCGPGAGSASPSGRRRRAEGQHALGGANRGRSRWTGGPGWSLLLRPGGAATPAQRHFGVEQEPMDKPVGAAGPLGQGPDARALLVLLPQVRGEVVAGGSRDPGALLDGDRLAALAQRLGLCGHGATP